MYELKQRLYNMVSKPVLKYGSETWILLAQDYRCLEPSQRCIMRVFVGKKRRDRIRN